MFRTNYELTLKIRGLPRLELTAGYLSKLCQNSVRSIGIMISWRVIRVKLKMKLLLSPLSKIKWGGIGRSIGMRGRTAPKKQRGSNGRINFDPAAPSLLILSKEPLSSRAGWSLRPILIQSSILPSSRRSAIRNFNYSITRSPSKTQN